MKPGMTIDILCRVVDNFGDIGVVYRLGRALSELPEDVQLRLIVVSGGASYFFAPNFALTTEYGYYGYYNTGLIGILFKL